MSPFRKFDLLDQVVFGYTAWVLLFVLALGDRVDGAASIVLFHGFVLAAMLVVPARGAPWEHQLFGDGWARHLRGGLRFFRYTYPLLLVLFFFEEVQHTVGAVYPHAAYWFESRLYDWDHALFGELPSRALNAFVGLPQDELFHGFYFSYYFILIGGVVYAYLHPSRKREVGPGPAFYSTITTAILAFVMCFFWYPFLPARGPWENPELMSGLTPFEGFLFTPIIERIIDHGAVSGGCFPSSHVAGSWGITLGLFRFDRRVGAILAFFAAGLSLSCIYTRYHHGVDVPAGFLVAVVAALIVRAVIPAHRVEVEVP